MCKQNYEMSEVHGWVFFVVAPHPGGRIIENRTDGALHPINAKYRRGHSLEEDERRGNARSPPLSPAQPATTATACP